MAQVRKSLFSFSLIILFTLYVVNLTVFTHIHYVNGEVIAHSHPFSGQHTHSCSECSWLSGFSTLFSFDPVVTDIQIELHYTLYRYNKNNITSLIKAELLGTPDLRGPPSFQA